MRLALVGNDADTHIGGSLRRAAQARGHQVDFFSVEDASAGSWLRRAMAWRLRRQAPALAQFSARVAQAVTSQKPELLIVTGLAPLNAAAVRAIRAAGVPVVNYATDDPWNPAFKADWLLAALAQYDHVFSPRRANLSDLQQLGVSASYLPFGYDAELFRPAPARPPEYDIFFAGHADSDRFELLAPLLDAGFRFLLHGRGWERAARFASSARGQLDAARFADAVAGCAVALCPVRKANRDGHAMRTFELAALRACILAEDTVEHREIYGDTVAWFGSGVDLPGIVRELLADEGRRAALAQAAHLRIVQGANTYADRLEAMLQWSGRR